MDLVITGYGALSCVGQSAATTCASIRAGLCLPREIHWFSVLDEEQQALVPLTGHPIRGYTDGFAELGRLIRLAHGAVRSLQNESGLLARADARFWERTGLIFVGPPLEEDRFEDAEEDVDELKASVLAQLIRALGLPLSEQASALVDIGPAGAADAIYLAVQRITQRQVERVILVAADSCLDSITLEWLLERGWLKSPRNPVGLVPGEAAACVMLESRSSAQRRGARVTAVVRAAATDREEAHALADKTSTGAGLSRAILKVTSGGGAPARFEGDVIIDLDGVPWRAAEWGYAQVRCADVLGPNMKLVLPCGSLGHVGAASAVLGLVIAARSLERGYASRGQSLILASSGWGYVGAVLVGAGR
ncbi:hypothetical protein [Sorangium sp. So ce394]|uniref:hypothetical protein n=1 Tax=Sorangium sp. So ce394 TaxID=3133310 RepID=UPI003F5B47A6